MTNQNKIKSNVSLRSSQNIFFNTCFDKNHLKTLIAWFLEQYGEKVTVDLVETLKQVGFHQATRAGVSLGVDDLKIPPQKNTLLSQASLKMHEVTNAIQTGNLTSVEKSQRLIDTWNQTSETLRQTAVQNFRTTNPVNPVYMMAFSGARGNISQVRQLVAMRGLMADPQGAILEFPIQSNFREGLTVTEYLISCYGARKGLVDTALRTATSGYLTRRLVDAVQHVVVHVRDCQTKKGIVLKNKNLEQRLIGRVLFEDITLKTTDSIKKNTLISQRLAKQIGSQYKEIVVRSPLTCQTEKSVCQLCYGLDLSQGKLVSIGEAVGIIAAQSIGEPGTQLTMRTFHTGGVGVFSEQAMKSFNAPFEGKVEFLEPLSGLFVRTPHGNIVYLLKHKSSQENKPILKLTSFQPQYKPSVYQIMQSDVPSGSLLWVKQGEYVKTGQLLLQASRLQTTTQEMPESSHPVKAPISGEIFFQSMAIRIIEEEKRLIPKTKKKKQQSGIASQINQKEISPKFPTLIELGNFWIFSTFVQKETKICNSFFLKGDLISSQTPIQQYNLHCLHTGQLKKVNSSLVFGHNFFEFLFSKIQYSGVFYYLQESFPNLDRNSKKKTTTSNLLVYTNNSNYTLLTWYPFFKKKSFQFSGYCSVLRLESDYLGLKNSELTENSKGLISQKQDFLRYQDVNSIWSPHEVFRLKTNRNQFRVFDKSPYLKQNQFIPSSCFLISQTSKNLSKTGIFQFETNNKVNWKLKTRFDKNFVKYFHQNSSKNVFQIHSANENKLEKINKNSLFGRDIFFTKLTSPSTFVKKSLDFSHKTLFRHPYATLIEKKNVWAYIPENSILPNVSSQLTGIILQPAKKFESFRFTNSYVSTNLINQNNIVFVKSKTNKSFSFYLLSEILDQTKNELGSVIQKSKLKIELKSKKFIKVNYFNRKIIKTFCFYKQQGVFQSRSFLFEIRKFRRLSHLLLLQKNFHQIYLNSNFFKQNWLFRKKVPTSSFLKSPFFTKQYKTSFKPKRNVKPSFRVISPNNSGWFSVSSFLKIELKFHTSKCFDKREQLKQNFFWPETIISDNQVFDKNHSSINYKKQIKNQNLNRSIFEADRANLNYSNSLMIPGFSLFFYQEVKLQNSNQFQFLTFRNGWVLPELKITEAFLTSKKLGEFRGAQEKQKQTGFSILRMQDRATIKLPGEKLKKTSSLVQVGTQIRWGQQVFDDCAVSMSGQILKTTLKTLTLRKGLPLVASIRGLVHISHKDLIEKNDLLITLRSRRLQTEDIVQGIPKIEQLFEARETQGGEIIQNNMHTLLNNFFSRARQVRPIAEAVQLSLTYIQKFLVENILEAYSNQGVSIAEKHVEVVVRQMTARVRITHGGDSGFLPGEYVQLRWIEKVNLALEKLGRREAHYEPIILGITKSVLQSESFLVAASFQQVSKVLVRSALAKKTDFLRGLHENILVGQPIPAGTGMIELTESIEKTKDFLETSE